MSDRAEIESFLGELAVGGSKGHIQVLFAGKFRFFFEFVYLVDRGGGVGVGVQLGLGVELAFQFGRGEKLFQLRWIVRGQSGVH